MLLHTCHSFHVLVRSAHRECVSVQWCDIISEFQNNAGRSTGLKNQSAHVVEWTVSTKLFARGVTSQEPHQGGYAGVRLEKCRTQGQPNTKEITQKKNASARRTGINEAGDAVPGSQDSITRGVQNLQLADVPAAQPVRSQSPAIKEPTEQRPRHQRAFLQCAQCGADPLAYTGNSDSG